MTRAPWWVPNERQAVTVFIGVLIVIMFLMASRDPALWDNETFKDVLKTVVITGLLNMIVAFHFAANKGDEEKTANTGKAFDAITAAHKHADAVKPEERE